MLSRRRLSHRKKFIMSTQVTVIGTVATDPKRITTQSGAMLCSFRLASDERRYDRTQQKWIEGETNWYSISVFRALGEHAHSSLHKGERVIVSGRLRVRRWESEGKAGTSVEIDADAVGHDLRWGVSAFEKREAQANTSGSETWAAASVSSLAIEASLGASDADSEDLLTSITSDDGFIPGDTEIDSAFGGPASRSDDGSQQRGAKAQRRVA